MRTVTVEITCQVSIEVSEEEAKALDTNNGWNVTDKQKSMVEQKLEEQEPKPYWLMYHNVQFFIVND